MRKAWQTARIRCSRIADLQKAPSAAGTLRMPIVRRIAFLLSAVTSLTAYDHSALADTGPCSSIEYERAKYAVCEVDLHKHTVRLIGTDQTGLLMAIYPPCRALSKAGQAGCYSPPTPACSMPTSSLWACTWNRGANSCTQTSSPAEAIFT